MHSFQFHEIFSITDQTLIKTMLKNARRRYTHSCIGCRCSSSNINLFRFRRFFHALMFSILFKPATLSYFSLSSHIISRHCSNFVFFIASLQKCQRTKFSFNSKRSRSRSDPSKGTRYKHANIPRSIRNFKLDHLLFKAVKFQDDSLTQDFLISDS